MMSYSFLIYPHGAWPWFHLIKQSLYFWLTLTLYLFTFNINIFPLFDCLYYNSVDLLFSSEFLKWTFALCQLQYFHLTSSSNSPEGATILFRFSEYCLPLQMLGGSRSEPGQSQGVSRLSDLLCPPPPPPPGFPSFPLSLTFSHLRSNSRFRLFPA